MIRKILAFLVVLISLLSPLQLNAQADKLTRKEEVRLEEAEAAFADGNYLRALPIYMELQKAHPSNAYLNYQLGICYLYKTDEKEKSITHLEIACKGNRDLPLVRYWLGRAYHLNYRFDEAIRLFNEELDNGEMNEKERIEVARYVEYCNNAKLITRDTLPVEITNLGPPLNTENSEYVPVITIDESMLIFTYTGTRSTGGLQDPRFRPDTTGQYYEDIMVSQKVGDQWFSPDPISNNINTNGHDASIALSNDGQILFIFKSTTKDGGDIFMSKLQGNQWSTPERLGSNINTKWWEGSCSLSGDGKQLFFASERPGGFGGRDIYVSDRQLDGSWGPARNLGPAVNTRYNDDAPYIHPDGIHLIFSSQGHNSIGGYDLFFSLMKDGVWGPPQNIGYPVNTPGNERFYVLSADGATGYYSSDRRGSLGQQDLYTASPGFMGEPPIIALVVGFVTLDGNPVEANINVSNAETGEQYGNYNSNSATGKYLIALKPGNKYKVAIEVEGAAPYYEYINVKGVDTYVQVQKDYNFVSAGDSVAYYNPPSAIADSSETLQRKLDDQIKAIKAEQNDQVYEERIYKQLLKKYGDTYDSTDKFVVELGTYENPSLFDSTKVADMGPVVRTVTPEGYVRYTVGPFKTLLDAELYRARLATRDSLIASNSEVTVLDNGVRKTVPVYYKKEYKRRDYKPREDTRVIMSSKGTLETTIGTNYSYDKIVNDYGTFQSDGLTYKLELASVRDTNDFKLQHLAQFGPIEKKVYPDGTIRYQMGPWRTLKEAEDFKAYLMTKDSAAAKSIVTIFYFSERKTVPEFFQNPPEAIKPLPTIKTTPPAKNTTTTSTTTSTTNTTTTTTTTTNTNDPCSSAPVDLAWFKDKSLNDPAVYAKFLQVTGNYCTPGLIYKVQIGAYRHPENFKYPQLKEFGAAEIINYPDGITRFTLLEFKTIKEAEAFRQECIRRGITDAWITAVYNGQRKTLEELIDANFYGKQIN